MSTSRVGFAVARRTAGRATLSALVAITALATGSTGCDTLRARARAQKGVEKYRDGDIKGAATLFREAAEIDPTVPPIILNRGFTHLQLYQQNPRSKEGVEAANIAIASFKEYMKLPELTPEQLERARDYLLQTFVDARRYDDAVEYFKPQTERENPDLQALTILGNIAKSVGKTEDARKWVERRVKANPKDTDGFVTLATMDWDELCNDSQCRTAPDQRKGHLQMPPDKRWEKANHGIDLLKKAIELSPQAPSPVVYANLLLRERSYAAATDDFKRYELDTAVALGRLSMAMQKAAGAATAAPAPAAPTDGGSPPDLAPPDTIKSWKPSESVQAVQGINTAMPPACPVAPPVDPKARRAPPPPPAPTTVCIPSWYPGMLPPPGVPTAIVYPSTGAPAPVAPPPGAAAPAPAPAAAPAPAPAPAAPKAAPPAPAAPKAAAPAPAAPKAAAPAPAAPKAAAPAPAAPKPKAAPAPKAAETKPAQPNTPTPPKVVVDEDGEN